MGFYGNIKNTSRTQFYFDRIYPNRKAMEDNKTKDNIFAGRYVLIEYESGISANDFQSCYNINGVMYTEVVSHTATSASDPTKTIDVIDSGLEQSRIKVTDVVKNQIVSVPIGQQITSTTETDTYIRFTSSRGNYVTATKLEYDYYYNTHLSMKDPGIAIINSRIYATTPFQIGQYAILKISNVYNTTPSLQYFKVAIKLDAGQNPESISWELLSGVTTSNKEKSNFIFNQNIDKSIYGTDRTYDSTVWQKIYNGTEEKYLMVSDLNTIKPVFSFTTDAPTMTPLPIHYDQQNTNTNYNVHMQSQWGIRTRAADGGILVPEIRENGQISNTLGSVQASLIPVTYPSDQSTKWRGDFFDLTKDQESTKFFSPISSKWNAIEANISSEVPAAIYFNKDGFSPDRIVKSRYLNDDKNYYYRPQITCKSDEDMIGLQPTGYSGRLYNSHLDSEKHQPQVDTQEFVFMLPSLGDTISDMWDLIYGGEELNTSQQKLRNKHIEWESANEVVKRDGLRALEGTSNGGLAISTLGANTLAGCINTAHDIIGQIIVDDCDSLNIYNYEDTFIYYSPRDKVFKRKAMGYDYEEVTYSYEPIQLSGTSYAPSQYYYSGDGETFIACHDESFDASKQYYIKKVEFQNSYTRAYLSGKPNYNMYYKTPSGDYRYTSDVNSDIPYYRFISAEEILVTARYQPYYFYYLTNDGSGYQIDVAEEATPNRTYFTIYADGTERGPRAVNLSLKDISFYSENTQDYFVGTDPNNGSEIREPLKYVYCPGSFYRMDVTTDSNGKITRTLIQMTESYDSIDLTKDYYILKGHVAGAGGGESWVVNEDGSFSSSAQGETLRIEKLCKVKLLPFIEQKYFIKSGVIKKPDDINDLEFDDDIVPDGETTNPDDDIDTSNSMVAKYEYVTIENLKEIYKNEFNYDQSGVPVFVNIYTMSPEDAGTFYKEGVFYYQTKDSSLVIDTNKEMTEDRTYYSSVSFTKITGFRFYYPNNYYYYDENLERYILDKSNNFTPGRAYYEYTGDLFVIEDTLNVFAKYSRWNDNVTLVPVSIRLATRTKRFQLVEMPEMGRKLNTMHGLILKINKLLEIDNYQTRDRGTIQGCINIINDIINKFDALQPGKILITDDYGRVNNADWNTLQKVSSTLMKATNATTDTLLKGTGQDKYQQADTVAAMRGQWLTAHINSNPNEPLITVHHNFQPVKSTTSASNKNTDNVASGNAYDKINLYTPIVDEMGHVVGKNIETVTLPYSFKTFATNGSSTGVSELTSSNANIIAENTQDTFTLNTGNKWLRFATTPASDVMTIAHTLTPISAQANTDYGLISDKTIDILDRDNTFEVPCFRFDEAGHIIKAETHTITIPDLSTKYIAVDSTFSYRVGTNAATNMTVEQLVAKVAALEARVATLEA